MNNEKKFVLMRDVISTASSTVRASSFEEAVLVATESLDASPSCWDEPEIDKDWQYSNDDITIVDTESDIHYEIEGGKLSYSYDFKTKEIKYYV